MPIPSDVSITCRCGHQADFDAFRRTPIRGELPAGHYQCPACRSRWTMRPSGPPSVRGDSFIIPAPLALIPLDPVL